MYAAQLQSTSALDPLLGPDETAEEAVKRAKTYVLLFMVVQQTYGFAAAPRWLASDKENDRSSDDGSSNPYPGYARTMQDQEHVGLLDDVDGEADDIEEAARELGDIVKPKVPKLRTPRWLKKTLSYFNPPLIAAVVAIVVGVRSMCTLSRSQT